MKELNHSSVYRLVIVGAGLSALSALQAGLNCERALMLDYQERPGGFLRSVLPAPGFEEVDALARTDTLPAGLTAYFNSTAVRLLPASSEGEAHALLVNQSDGEVEIRAEQILLACGGLELTREAAQIPGPRPAGIMTPIFALQLLSRGYTPGKQIVVYGSSRYALATAQRLAAAGLSVTLVGAAGQPDVALPVTPSSLSLLLPARLVALSGSTQLEQLTFERMGEQFTLEADALVYAVGMRANTRWLEGSGLAFTPQGALKVDERYQTNVPGIYAIGTVVSPSLDHQDSLRMGRELAGLLL